MLNQECDENHLYFVSGICRTAGTIAILYTRATTLAEGQIDVMIPAFNRSIDPNIYYPLHLKLPAVWSDNSNAIQWLKNQSRFRVVLDEVLRSRGGIHMTVDELAPHGDESVEFLVNDEVIYHAGPRSNRSIWVIPLVAMWTC